MSRRRQFEEPAVVHAYWPHSDAEPAHPEPASVLPAGLSCVRKCTTHGLHASTCACALTCEPHRDHCTGCLPTPAIVGQFCQSCLTQVRSALNQIPDLVAHAGSRRDGRLSPGSGSDTDHTRRATKVDQLSLSPAWDRVDEVIQWAHRTALMCANENRHRGPFQYRVDGVPARALSQSVAYILRNLPWYAQHRPAIYDEATGLRRALEHDTGMDELVHRIKSPCPTCNHRTLVREDGSDRVMCRNRNCRRVWSEGEYDWLAHVATA